MQRSMVLPNQFEESESLSKIQCWLEMGELALGEKKISLKQRPALGASRTPPIALKGSKVIPRRWLPV